MKHTLTQNEEATIRAYDDGGSTWSGQRSGEGLYADELKTYADIVPSGQILDVGSGNGRDALLLTDAGFQVHCLDLSATLLDIAKERCPGADFTLGSMYDLPFEDRSFDGAWMVASLIHIPRDKAALPLLEARRVVKDQGGLFLTVKEGTGETMSMQGGLDERLFVYWQEKALTELLEKCGWNTVKVSRRVINDPWLLVWAQAV